jgi:alpha-1,2-mannosyltransferase
MDQRFWLCAAVLGSVAGVILLILTGSGGMIDLRVYRMGGSVLLQGNSLYDAHLPGSGLPFTYPPFAAVTMVPLAALPWVLAKLAWTVGSVLCLVAIWRCSLTTRMRWSSTAAVLALTAGSFVLEPVWQTIQFGQINLVLMAMILLDLVGSDQRRTRGVWVGIAAGLKLTPIIFLGFLLVTGQWRALRNAVLGLLATVVVGFALVPYQSWDYWTRVVADAERVGGLAYTANQSVMGFVYRLGKDASYVKPTWFVLSSLIALTVLWLARGLWRQHERVGAVAVTALAGLFASPVSWSHHWVWVIPLGVTLVTTTWRRTASPRATVATGAVWFGLFVITPIWWVPNEKDRELHWNLGQSVLGNAYLLAAVLVAAWLIYDRFAPARSAEAEDVMHAARR